MKNPLLIGLLCLGIGFGAAWLVKPGFRDENSADQAPVPKSQAAAARKGSSAAPEQPAKSGSKPEIPVVERGVVVAGEGGDADRKGVRAEVRSGEDRFREMMTRRQKAKEEARIKKLVDRLGLTEAQADKLRTHFDKNRADLAAMMEAGDEDWSKVKDFAKKIRGDSLDEALAGILTDEQKPAYEEMKQRDRQNLVEARAYKDLAKIQGVLDLSPEQKEDVYDVLYEQATSKVDTNQDARAMVSVFTEGLGISIDPEDLGISSAIQVQIDKASSGEQPDADPDAWLQAMKEGRQTEIEQEVGALAPVLNDDQEAAYRAPPRGRGRRPPGRNPRSGLRSREHPASGTARRSREGRLEPIPPCSGSTTS